MGGNTTILPNDDFRERSHLDEIVNDLNIN